MRAIERYFHLVLIITLYKRGKLNAEDWYFHVALFVCDTFENSLRQFWTSLALVGVKEQNFESFSSQNTFICLEEPVRPRAIDTQKNAVAFDWLHPISWLTPAAKFQRLRSNCYKFKVFLPFSAGFPYLIKNFSVNNKSRFMIAADAFGVQS